MLFSIRQVGNKVCFNTNQHYFRTDINVSVFTFTDIHIDGIVMR